MKWILFFPILFLAVNAFAGDLDLGSGKKITQEQLETLKKRFPKTTEDRIFYHWTSPANAMRWVTQKHINSGEISFLNKPTGNLQSYGPGFYIAEKPTSSKNFGEAPVSLVIKKGTSIYDPTIAIEVLGFSPDRNMEAKISEALSLLKPAANDWYVINNASHTQDIFYASFSNPEARTYAGGVKNWSPFTNMEKFKELVDSGDGDAKYLKDIFYASDYMDGVSFARAMKVNPGAPWEEFEPEGFEKYKQTLDYLSQKVEGDKTRADLLQEKGKTKLKEVILEVNNQLSGSSSSTIEERLRLEGIRAGGDKEGKMFGVTPEQLEVLEKNPYLELEVKKVDGKILVAYYYPDAFHYKKLKDRISPDLYQRLEKNSGPELLKNDKLRQSLNKELVSELMDDFITRMGKGSASWVDFISIHPFGDTNGRTSRLLQKIFNRSVTNVYIGDFDLLMAPESQTKLLYASSEAHSRMEADLIDEFLKAKTERRTPDYLKTGAIDRYARDAFVVPLGIDLNSKEDLKTIQNRDWEKLLTDGIPSGLDGLGKKFAEGKEAEDAGIKLMDILREENLNLYDEAGKGKILKLSDAFFESKDISLENKMMLFPRYQNVYEKVGMAGIKVKTLSENKSVLLEDIIRKMKESDNISEQTYILSFIDNIEPDSLKNIAARFEVIKSLPPGHSRELFNKNLIQRLIPFFANDDVFKMLGVDEQKFAAELYAKIFDDVLESNISKHELSNLLSFSEKINERLGSLAPTDVNTDILRKKILQHYSVIPTGLDLKTRANYYEKYEAVYETSEEGLRKNFPKPFPLKEKLLDDIQLSLGAATSSNELQEGYDLLRSIEKDSARTVDILLAASKQNPNPQLIPDLMNGSYWGLWGAAKSDEEKIRFLKKAPEILKDYLTKQSNSFFVESLVDNYRTSYASLPVGISSQVESADDLKKDIKLWAEKNPGPNNCVVNLLQTIFP